MINYSGVNTCIACKEDFIHHPKRALCLICAPTQNWYNTWRRYYVTKPIYDKMFKEQDGTCALCYKEASEVDHHHKTGVVRGILCHKCNMLMCAVDDEEWLERALLYAVSFRETETLDVDE